MSESEWTPFDQGKTIGHSGSEDGICLEDDEHRLGARITLEKDCRHAPFAITCGVYGWMFHTRYFHLEEKARQAFAAMKTELSKILEMIPVVNDPNVRQRAREVEKVISDFVERFP
jgi:hypothetical protein